MRASRIEYNEAVQGSDQRELLLNLVRLRYTEAPEFLAISGISTQMSFDAGASIGGDFGDADVELDSLYLLARDGWGLDRVLLLIAGEVNGIYNTVSREGGPAGVADLRGFQEIVSRLRRLERERLIRIDVQLRRETLSAVISDKLVSAGDMSSAVKDGYRMEYQAQPAGYVLTGECTHYVLAVDKHAWGHRILRRFAGH